VKLSTRLSAPAESLVEQLGIQGGPNPDGEKNGN
jgi:hypothetical protein